MFDPSGEPHLSTRPPPPYINSKKSPDFVNNDFHYSYNQNLHQKNQIFCGKNIDNGNKPVDSTQAPFNYNYALVNQMSLAAVTNSPIYPCEVCGLVFDDIVLLNQHKRVQGHLNNESHFTCSICGSPFASSEELELHKKSFHKVDKKLTVTLGVQTDENNENEMKDEKCNCNKKGKLSKSPEEVSSVGKKEEIYPKGYYPVKKKRTTTIAKCYKCDGSGVILVETVPPPTDKKYFCNICENAFSTYSSLWSHRRLHSGEKPYKCEVCGVGFARSSYLKNHLRVHTGERPFKCNVCDMQFSQSAHLKNHERIHSGERPYECDVCSKTFARHSTLWNHRRIHTGEKPYECGICGSSFNQATHLRNHVKVHTGEKQFSCDICEAGFSDRFALKRHRAIHEKFNQTGPTQTPDSWKDPSQENQSSEMNNQSYKCTESSSIAFPGCSAPSLNE